MSEVNPESKAFPLFGSFSPVPDIIVCRELSILFHVIICPAFTLIVFGSNPFSGFMEAPAGIMTLFSCVVCAAAAYDIRPSEIKPTAIANATTTMFFVVVLYFILFLMLNMGGTILFFKQLWSRCMMQNIRDCINVGKRTMPYRGPLANGEMRNWFLIWIYRYIDTRKLLFELS